MAGLLLLVPAASAHNGDRSSDPANGAVLTTPPTEVSFTFKQDIGRDSLTMILIEPSGTRTPLEILSAERRRAVAKLPPLPDGTYSVRWKLISSDGHPATNRITFTVATGATQGPAPVPTTVPTAAGATAATVAGLSAPTTSTAAALPPGELSVPTTGPAAAPAPPAAPPTSLPSDVSLDASGAAAPSPMADVDPGALADAQDVDLEGAPSWVRWLLRFGSYLAIFVVIGVVATASTVWPGAARQPVLITSAIIAVAAVAVLAVLQLVVLAHDIDPENWSAALRSTRNFDAGIALSARVVLAGAMLVVLGQAGAARLARVPALLLCAGMLATWAMAGHAASQRWPVVGVPIDVVHHFAAASWIGALAIVGVVAPRVVGEPAVRPMLARLSTLAFASVVVIVLTGIVQSIRIVGTTDVFASTHTRLLAVKLIVVAVMLVIANKNRTRLRSAAGHPSGTTGVRRLILGELVAGGVVIAVTASLVVASPAQSEVASSAHLGDRATR